MIHELKCWPEPFHHILTGSKRFEFRLNDRNYQVGDTLRLKEYWPDKKQYTGFVLEADVSYILTEGFGLPEGYCIMSIVI
jgi:hypothetical protein